MALHTAAAFLLLSVGLLAARPDKGVMALLTAEGHGGAVARRLLPAAILVPAVLGLIRLHGERMGFFGTEAGLALFALSNIAILSGLATGPPAAETSKRGAARHRGSGICSTPPPTW
jgi:hypothetical protein